MTPEILAFPPLERLDARWVALQGEGSEHLTLERNAGRITATGVVTGRADRGPFGAWYRIALDSAWQVKQLSVHLTDSRSFIATSREPGKWMDGDGGPLSQFDGCTDIDLACTPFTNTLPVRRLLWQPGTSRELGMLYLDFPDLTAYVARQRYTCLAPGRFRFEALGSGFAAEISVDRDGLVTDYPGLAKRLM